jgi:tetratricopeptide (TPR) repeat protein
MGAAGSVIRLETIPAEEIAKFVSGIGKEYKVYGKLIVDKNVSGEVLSRQGSEEELCGFLKSIGIKTKEHQKVLCTHLLKLMSATTPGQGASATTTATVTANNSSANADVTGGMMCTDGIKISVLHDFIMASGGKDAFKGLSSKDVSDKIIKPKTARNQTSYLELIRPQCRPGTIGAATVYISHLMRSPFLDLVDALVCRYGRNSDVLVWLDLFCCSQHILASSSTESRMNLVRAATSVFKTTLVVATPWDNPTQLTNAWCILELLVAIENKSVIEVTMSSTEENSYIDAILSDFEIFDKITTTVEMKNLTTSNPADKPKIVEELKKSRVSLNKINRVLNQQLREWTVRTMKRAYAEEEEPSCKLDFKVVLGALYRNMGKFADAELILAECYQHIKTQLGDDHPDTISSLCNLSSILESQGKYLQAEVLLGQGLASARRLLGDSDPITLTVTSSLADVLSEQQKYADAEPLYRSCLDASMTKLGPKHPDTLTSKNNLAYLFVSCGRYEDAEELLTVCLDERTKQLGADHPDTLSTIHNLAYLYKCQRKYAASEPLYFRALELHRVRLGEDHPSTLSSMCGLASVYECQGKLELADPLFAQATERGKAILGSTHPHVQEWKASYEKFNKKKNALKNVTKGASFKNEKSSRNLLV